MSDIIYPHGKELADKSGKLALYYESYRRNQDCAAAIEREISRHYEGYSLKRTVPDAVIEEFGYARTISVLAYVIWESEYDGRVSPENKAWAKTIPPLPYDRRNEYLYLNSNPGLVSIFTDFVRKSFEMNVLKSQSDIGNNVAGYTIEYSVLLSNDRGFAFASKAGDAEQCVTWQFTKDNGNGKRDYYWGHYISGQNSARLDFNRRLYDMLAYGAKIVNPLADVEMSTEQNYNMIDGQPNNIAAPKADLTDGQTHEEIMALAPEMLVEAEPSVLEQLREAKTVERPKNPQKTRSAYGGPEL